MSRLIALIFFIGLFTNSGQAQLVVTRETAQQIPKEIKYRGVVKDVISWKDSSGSFILITTETGNVPTADKESSGYDAEILSWCYQKKSDTIVLLWKMQDFITDCPFDLSVQFIKNTTAITDLDNDGVAEVWLMFKLMCTSDVSPSAMKIIMHEGKVKHAARGRNKTKLGPNFTEGGEMTFDAAFNAGPEVFRKYAEKLWSEHEMETWE